MKKFYLFLFTVLFSIISQISFPQNDPAMERQMIDDTDYLKVLPKNTEIRESKRAGVTKDWFSLASRTAILQITPEYSTLPNKDYHYNNEIIATASGFYVMRNREWTPLYRLMPDIYDDGGYIQVVFSEENYCYYIKCLLDPDDPIFNANRLKDIPIRNEPALGDILKMYGDGLYWVPDTGGNYVSNVVNNTSPVYDIFYEKITSCTQYVNLVSNATFEFFQTKYEFIPGTIRPHFDHWINFGARLANNIQINGFVEYGTNTICIIKDAYPENGGYGIGPVNEFRELELYKYFYADYKTKDPNATQSGGTIGGNSVITGTPGNTSTENTWYTIYDVLGEQLTPTKHNDDLLFKGENGITIDLNRTEKSVTIRQNNDLISDTNLDFKIDNNNDDASSILRIWENGTDMFAYMSYTLGMSFNIADNRSYLWSINNNPRLSINQNVINAYADVDLLEHNIGGIENAFADSFIGGGSELTSVHASFLWDVPIQENATLLDDSFLWYSGVNHDLSYYPLRTFKYIRVGQNTITADSPSDILTLESGNGIRLEPNESNDSIKIINTISDIPVSVTTIYSSTSTTIIQQVTPYLFDHISDDKGNTRFAQSENDGIQFKPGTGIDLTLDATNSIVYVTNTLQIPEQLDPNLPIFNALKIFNIPVNTTSLTSVADGKILRVTNGEIVLDDEQEINIPAGTDDDNIVYNATSDMDTVNKPLDFSPLNTSNDNLLITFREGEGLEDIYLKTTNSQRDLEIGGYNNIRLNVNVDNASGGDLEFYDAGSLYFASDSLGFEWYAANELKLQLAYDVFFSYTDFYFSDGFGIENLDHLDVKNTLSIPTWDGSAYTTTTNIRFNSSTKKMEYLESGVWSPVQN